MVGDIDVDKMEQKIRRTFADVPKPTKPAERVYYPVADNDKMIVAIDKDTEQPHYARKSLHETGATPDSEKNLVATARKSYVTELVTSMINSRLADIKRQATPPFHSASVGAGQFLYFKNERCLFTFVRLPARERERFVPSRHCRNTACRQHGFTESELQRAKAGFLKAAERRYTERNDRRNRYFVKAALQNFLASEPITTAEYDYKLMQQFDKEVTLADVNKEVAELVSNKNQVLTIYAPDKTNSPLPTHKP